MKLILKRKALTGFIIWGSRTEHSGELLLEVSIASLSPMFTTKAEICLLLPLARLRRAGGKDLKLHHLASIGLIHRYTMI